MRKLLTILLTVLVLGSALPASAQEKTFINLLVPIPLPNCNSLNADGAIVRCDGQLVTGVADFAAFTIALFQFGILFLSVLLVGIMMLGGLMYLASAGIPGRAQKGMDYIKNAAFSLLVLIFSVVILTQVNPALINLTLTGVDTIKQQASAQCPLSVEKPCGTEYQESGNLCVGTKCNRLVDYCHKNEPAEANQKATYECRIRKNVGATCTADSECWTNFCNEGKCIDDSKIGGSCRADADCSGFKCEFNGVPSCTFGIDGSDCNSNSECAPGYKCLLDQGNICFKSEQTPWSRCSDQSDCPGGSECKEPPYGTFTDTDILVCVPSTVEKVEGCSADTDCAQVSNDRPYCFAGNSGLPGTGAEDFCVSGNVGSPCKDGNDCRPDLRCTRYSDSMVGVCTRGLWGSGCVTSADCATGLTCSSKTGQNKFCNLGPYTGSK